MFFGVLVRWNLYTLSRAPHLHRGSHEGIQYQNLALLPSPLLSSSWLINEISWRCSSPSPTQQCLKSCSLFNTAYTAIQHDPWIFFWLDSYFYFLFFLNSSRNLQYDPLARLMIESIPVSWLFDKIKTHTLRLFGPTLMARCCAAFPTP